MKYRYETHLHTKESSACADCHGAEYPKRYQELGYSGIIVTDHFLNGNTTIDLSLSWEEQINQFCYGYEETKKAGDAIGFDVFFGWEHNFDRDEYLIYGCDHQWLLAHPDLLLWNHKKLYEEVHKAGGVMVQAHPFRMRNYISTGHLHPQHCDAIEVCNQGNKVVQDQLSFAYAKSLGLKVTSGTDIHHIQNADTSCKGIMTEKKLNSIQDFINLIKEGKGYDIITDANRSTSPESAVLDVPFDMYDYNERKILEIPAGVIQTKELMEKISNCR